MTFEPVHVSVILPVHNSKLHIVKRSINSIINQTFKNFELIVIDDINSTDVVAYLNQLVNTVPNIILIRNKSNLGCTESLRVGISAARGNLIARQDSDDWSHPERLRVCVAEFAANPSLVLVGTWYRLISPLGKTHSVEPTYSNRQEIYEDLLRTNPFAHSSVIFKRAEYLSLGGYDPFYRTSQDLDLWYRLISIGDAVIVRRHLLLRRLQVGGVSLTKTAWLQVYNGLIIRLKNLRGRSSRLYLVLIIYTMRHFLIVCRSWFSAKKFLRLEIFNSRRPL